MLTNACGTRIVADAAAAAGALATVLISTDKAVNPSSLMGASKRLAEMYCQSLDELTRRRGGMRCVTVRFGNVLGSTGSVVPLFRRQLARGGPLTVTHPDMQRYFMTVREAVGLVLQASGGGRGRTVIEDGGIFVLDMGEAGENHRSRAADDPPRRACGRTLDVPIRFTGLRPGEKLYEELFHGQEPPVAHRAFPRPADGDAAHRRPGDLSVVPSTRSTAACRAGEVTRQALSLLEPAWCRSSEHNVDGTAGIVRA